MPIVADAAIAIRADMAGFKQDVQKGATGGAAGIKQALSPQNIGRAFSAAGAAGGAAFATSIELASNFEDQLRTINTVAGLSDAELGKLGDNIQQLARDSGKSTDDLTGAYYDLVSAGVPAEHALDVLRDSSTLATGALSTTGEAVDLVTSTLNAYGLQASESGRITDIFAKTVQDGKVTAAELASSIAKIAPIAATAGVKIEEVAAGYATLTAKGVPAAEASTQMRAAISSLLTPNETLNRLQEQTGKNFADIAREKGLGVALEELRKATAGNATALDELAGVSGKDFPKALKAAQDQLGLTNSDVEKFTAMAGKDGAGAAMAELVKQVGVGDSAFAKSLGSIDAYSFAVNTTGAAFADSQAELGEFGGAIDGLATEQAAEKMKSPTEAANRLTQQFLTFMQDVGGPFASTMGPVLLTLNNLAPALKGLLSPAKLAGGLIGGLAGKLIAGAAGLIPALGGVFAAAGSAIGGIFTAAAGLIIAAWPLVLLALVVAAIALLLTNPEIREKALAIGKAIVDFIGQAIGKIGEVLGAIVGAVIELGGKVVGAVADFVGKIVGAILSIPGRVAGLFVALLQAWVGLWVKIIGAGAEGVRRVVGFILGIPGRVAGFVGQLIGQAGRAAAGMVGAIAGGVGKVVGFILGIPGRVAGWIGGLIGGAARAAGGLVSNIAGGVGKVVGFVLGIPGRVAGWIGGLIGGAGRAAAGFVGGIGRMAGNVISTILGIPGKIVGGLVSGFGSAASQAVGAFLGPIAGIPGAVGDILGNVGGFLGGLVPKFQTGTMEVPADMLALVHAGEIIIPAGAAEAIREGQATFGRAGAYGEGGGGDTIIVNLLDKMTVRTPRDIHDGLRQLKATGNLGKRKGS